MLRRLDTVPGVVLVSIAAAMWGLDGLIRKPLAGTTSPYTIVFGEHVVLVLLTLPLLVPAMRALWAAGPRYVAAGIAVGAGASAIATILFTKALLPARSARGYVSCSEIPEPEQFVIRSALGRRGSPSDGARRSAVASTAKTVSPRGRRGDR